MSGDAIRIATRASRLALWQAHHVADLIRAAASEREVEIVHISTVGDRDQSEALSQFGGMGVFTREVQKAVLDGRADIAVHSLKDLPTEQVAGLSLAGIPERGPRFDVLVFPENSESGRSRAELADPAQLSDKSLISTGARIGTGSLRRQAQLLHLRDDLQLLEIRGNVETRLRKLDDGEYDVLVLAEAGLKRLELAERINFIVQPPIMYPAVSQGALGIECREDDELINAILHAISDETTKQSVTAERSLLATLRAGCHAPLGVNTSITDDQLSLEAVVLSPDGKERVTVSSTSPSNEAVSLGEDVAELLKAQGADKLIANQS